MTDKERANNTITVMEHERQVFTQQALDYCKTISLLEQENVNLKNEIIKLKENLKFYKKEVEFLSDFN